MEPRELEPSVTVRPGSSGTQATADRSAAAATKPLPGRKARSRTSLLTGCTLSQTTFIPKGHAAELSSPGAANRPGSSRHIRRSIDPARMSSPSAACSRRQSDSITQPVQYPWARISAVSRQDPGMSCGGRTHRNPAQRTRAGTCLGRRTGLLEEPSRAVSLLRKRCLLSRVHPRRLGTPRSSILHPSLHTASAGNTGSMQRYRRRDWVLSHS